MRRLVPLSLVLAMLAGAATAAAQIAPMRPAAPSGLPDVGPFSGGVPTGQRTEQPLPLTLADALARGLSHNLGVISREQDIEGARSVRWQALSAVLPNVSGRVGESREVINLAAMGFSGVGDFPQIIGPFNVFDARLFVSQPVIDPSGLFRLREADRTIDAARHGYRNARDLVVLAVTNLYLQAIAADSRVASARAQVETAEALARLSADRKQAGLVPAIDVLRAQVQLESERQRLIVAGNTSAKQKLALARAIGLPLGQAIALADAMPYAPSAVPSLDDALKQAYGHREDLQAQQAAVAAAEAAGRAAVAEHLPSLSVDANWGSIGETAGGAVPTYAVAANVRVPIFSAGTGRAHAIQADATLRRRQAELEDARARVFYDVQSALLDVQAAHDQAEVAARAVTLAEQQLTQARDRFASGVADTIEVVQAQEALAGAHDARIASLYGYNAARAALAGALGLAEEEMPRFLGGRR